MACDLGSELFNMSCLYAHLLPLASYCPGRRDSCLTSLLSADSCVPCITALWHGHRASGSWNLIILLAELPVKDSHCRVLQVPLLFYIEQTAVMSNLDAANHQVGRLANFTGGCLGLPR